MPRLLVLLSILLTGGAIAVSAQTKRAVTPDDFYAFKSADDPQISPDGRMVAYVVLTADREQDRWQRDLFLSPIDGSTPPRQLTFGDSSSAPHWRPDGSALAFLSSQRDSKTGAPGKGQVYLLPMTGGEAHAVTNLKNGVTAFEWSPDGTKLACVSHIGPSDHAAPGTKFSDEMDYEYPEIKFDGSGYYNDQRRHIWIVDVATGASHQITFGDQRNDGDPEWSPDGKTIAFLGARTDARNNMGGNDAIYLIPAAGGAETKLPVSTMGNQSLAWSPDGSQIAYVGCADAVFMPKLWIAPAAGGPAKLVSQDLTYPASPFWSSDARSLYYRAPVKGFAPLFRIDIDSAKITPLTAGSTATHFDFDAKTNQIAYVAAEDLQPAEVFAFAVNDPHPHQLTHLNAELLSNLELVTDTPISFKSDDGWTIDGYFTKPLHWEAGKSYPMVLMVHGGPNGMWGSNWDFTEQCFAAHGWAVLRVNPRGSSGYGEAFQRGVFKSFGAKPYDDLMNGVDAALAQYSWVDKDRLGVAGHSYGGFMTNWIIGHTTRFKAAVAQSGMTNFISDDGARDAYYGHERDIGVQFWDSLDTFWKNSPLLYADKVKTPTLFLQGEVDMRVPKEQAEEYFRALNHFGVPTELVIFPGESHVPGKTPIHVNDWMRWQIYWFDRWLDSDPHAERPNAFREAAAK